MKWCGKSAPRPEQSGWQGKPHAEQDQIGEEGRPVPLLLPGRSLEPDSNIRPRGMTTARKGTETGLQSGNPLKFEAALCFAPQAATLSRFDLSTSGTEALPAG